MNFTPPPSTLVERKCNDSLEYVLTVNNITAVCPYKAPIPQYHEDGHVSFAFSACGSSCPLFAFELEQKPRGVKKFDLDEKESNEDDSKLFINLTCGNGSGRHPIESVIYLPKPDEAMFQDVVEIEGIVTDEPTGKVVKL